jgi:hypothetical protein
MSHSLAALIRAVKEARAPSRELDRAIWEEIDPQNAFRSNSSPPFFTDDPNAAKSILPSSAMWIISERIGPSEFRSTVIGKTAIEVTHNHRFLAACLVALEVLAYARSSELPLIVS